MWVDDGEMHNLVVGSTGAGKTSLVVFPQVHSLAKKGESIIFSAGDTSVATAKLSSLYETEVSVRTPRTSFFNCLKNSAQQFYFRPTENDAYLLAGYPWFKVRARDLFAALPGCTLSIDDPVRFEKIMNTAMPAIRTFMKDGKLDSVIREIDQPDVTLWAIWAIQQYAKDVGLDRARDLYGSFVHEILEYICNQQHPDMKLMDDGMLFADGRDKAITWMNSTINGKPVVPRSGYIVEFNALWYNALCFYSEMYVDKPVEKFDQLIKKMDISFPDTFGSRLECSSKYDICSGFCIFPIVTNAETGSAGYCNKRVAYT